MPKGKFHVGKNGPAPCSAQVKCRLGGESGNENHFETFAEAQEFHEKKLESEMGGALVKPQKKEKPKHVIAAEKAAKDYSSSHKGSHHDSSFALGRPDFDATYLDEENFKGFMRDAFVRYSDLYKDDEELIMDQGGNPYFNALSSNNFSDKHYRALKAVRNDSHFRSFGLSSVYQKSIIDHQESAVYIYQNKNNKISDKLRKTLKNEPEVRAHLAREGELSDREIRSMPGSHFVPAVEGLYHEALKDEEDPKKIDAYVDGMIEHTNSFKSDDKYLRERVFGEISRNKNVSRKTLEKLVQERDFRTNESLQEAAIGNSRLVDREKRRLSELSPRAKTEYSIFKKFKKSSEDLKKDLQISYPKNSGRSIDYHLDRRKLREMGVTQKDLKSIFNDQFYEVESYDDENGVLTVKSSRS